MLLYTNPKILGPPPGFKVSKLAGLKATMGSSYGSYNDEKENDLDQSLFPAGIKESGTDGIVESPGINPFLTYPNDDTSWLTQDINRPHSVVCIFRMTFWQHDLDFSMFFIFCIRLIFMIGRSVRTKIEHSF